MKVWIIVYRHKRTSDDYSPVANQRAYLEDELELAKGATQYLENMNKMYEYRIFPFSDELFEDLEGQDFEEGGEDFDEEEVEEEAQPA